MRKKEKNNGGVVSHELNSNHLKIYPLVVNIKLI